MKMFEVLVACGCLSLAVASLCGQTTSVARPTNDEAKSTCLTLEHLLVVARSNSQAQEAAALSVSYGVVRKYVTDAASVKGADEYVQYYLQHFGASHSEAVSPIYPQPGFTWIKPIADLSSDEKHHAGALVYDKNGSTQNLHFALDKDSVVKLLKANGAVAAEAAKP
jgi:hypothetical protein